MTDSITALGMAIRCLHPNLEPGVDWYFQDDGSGPYLSKWPAGLQYPTPEDVAAAKRHIIEAAERKWRDAELLKADIEVYKAADAASVSEHAWRQYRAALRDWPQSGGFPDETKRPAPPVEPQL